MIACPTGDSVALLEPSTVLLNVPSGVAVKKSLNTGKYRLTRVTTAPWSRMCRCMSTKVARLTYPHLGTVIVGCLQENAALQAPGTSDVLFWSCNGLQGASDCGFEAICRQEKHHLSKAAHAVALK